MSRNPRPHPQHHPKLTLVVSPREKLSLLPQHTYPIPNLATKLSLDHEHCNSLPPHLPHSNLMRTALNKNEIMRLRYFNPNISLKLRLNSHNKYFHLLRLPCHLVTHTPTTQHVLRPHLLRRAQSSLWSHLRNRNLKLQVSSRNLRICLKHIQPR